MFFLFLKRMWLIKYNAIALSHSFEISLIHIFNFMESHHPNNWEHEREYMDSNERKSRLGEFKQNLSVACESEDRSHRRKGIISSCFFLTHMFSNCRRSQ